MHSHFNEEDIYSVDADTSAMNALLMSAFEELSKTKKVSDLTLNTDNADIITLLEILKDTTVFDAMNMFQALQNAVTHERIEKTKAWKVKDLDITIL